MDKRNPSPHPGSSPILRLSPLPGTAGHRGTLRTVGLDGPGPRFARLRALRATQVTVQTSRGTQLPGTDLTWSLSRRGVALSLLVGN